MSRVISRGTKTMGVLGLDGPHHKTCVAENGAIDLPQSLVDSLGVDTIEDA